MAGRNRSLRDNEGSRRYPLPTYNDASRIWHYHVFCPTCRPRELGLPKKGIINYKAARYERDKFNRIKLFMQHRHRYVMQGCADPDCILAEV